MSFGSWKAVCCSLERVKSGSPQPRRPHCLYSVKTTRLLLSVKWSFLLLKENFSSLKGLAGNVSTHVNFILMYWSGPPLLIRFYGVLGGWSKTLCICHISDFTLGAKLCASHSCLGRVIWEEPERAHSPYPKIPALPWSYRARNFAILNYGFCRISITLSRTSILRM